jgi:hypothetical protein
MLLERALALAVTHSRRSGHVSAPMARYLQLTKCRTVAATPAKHSTGELLLIQMYHCDACHFLHAPFPDRLIFVPLKKREFDLQQNLPSTASGGHLAQTVLQDILEIVSVCYEFKSKAGGSSIDHLDHLMSAIMRWGKRDAPFNRKNSALASTSSALRLMKQWVMRVVSVAELESSATRDMVSRPKDVENHQKTIERVLLQQRCAVSEWLKQENSNKALLEEIKKQAEAASDAMRGGDENHVCSLTCC